MPEGTTRSPAGPRRLQRLQRPCRGVGRAGTRNTAGEDRRRAGSCGAGVRALRARRRRREDPHRVARQEPCGGKRDAEDAAPGSWAIRRRAALNDGIADGRDVSWIWDVDFEALAARLIGSSPPASARARTPVLVRRPGRGENRDRARAGRGTGSGLELTEPGGELVFLATYTAMLGLQRVIADRGHAAVLGARGVRVVLAHLYPDYPTSTPIAATSRSATGRAQRHGIDLDVHEVGLGDARPRRRRLLLHRRRPGP